MRINRIILLISISFIVFSFITQKDKNTIYWHERSLTWQDFKYKPKEKSGHAAITSSGIELIQTSKSNAELNLRITAFFNKENSWRKEKKPGDYLLNHEQRHFDINEIFARRLRKRIGDTSFVNRGIAQRTITRMHLEELEEERKYQDIYDLEANHSINKEEQEVWNKKIYGELDSLKEYSNPEIVLKW